MVHSLTSQGVWLEFGFVIIRAHVSSVFHSNTDFSIGVSGEVIMSHYNLN